MRRPLLATAKYTSAAMMPAGTAKTNAIPPPMFAPSSGSVADTMKMHARTTGETAINVATPRR